MQYSARAAGTRVWLNIPIHCCERQRGQSDRFVRVQPQQTDTDALRRVSLTGAEFAPILWGTCRTAQWHHRIASASRRR